LLQGEKRVAVISWREIYGQSKESDIPRNCLMKLALVDKD
jgi:hypothetical protein